MGEKSKGVNKSEEDKWRLVDEKIYHFQGPRPKPNREQRLLAIRPGLNEEKQGKLALLCRRDRHFLPESKCTLRSPQELILVDNVSLVTDQMGNKLPHCHTNCGPLPRKSLCKILPSRVSPCRMPFSGPEQMSSSFQWPSPPELQNYPTLRTIHSRRNLHRVHC